MHTSYVFFCNFMFENQFIICWVYVCSCSSNRHQYALHILNHIFVVEYFPVILGLLYGEAACGISSRNEHFDTAQCTWLEVCNMSHRNPTLSMLSITSSIWQRWTTKEKPKTVTLNCNQNILCIFSNIEVQILCVETPSKTVWPSGWDLEGERRYQVSSKSLPWTFLKSLTYPPIPQMSP